MNVYTDGSCDNRAQPGNKTGGWAFALERPEKLGVWYLFYGYLAPDTTNNIAELYGFRNAMAMLSKKGGNQVIHCDSTYVSYPVNRKTSWEAKGLEGRKNPWLVQQMFDIMNRSTTKFSHKWVRGHSGIVGNEVADRGAYWGERQQPKPDVSSLEMYYGIKVVPYYFQTPDDYDRFVISKNL